ncbi:hypothetical protein DFJ74DRAFT_320686 [Hyaloraphidium curvatum]|nr:hypothetical protein DFJ74DRAFT_320686 [Hyaloraphidium curvatum]
MQIATPRKTSANPASSALPEGPCLRSWERSLFPPGPPPAGLHHQPLKHGRHPPRLPLQPQPPVRGLEVLHRVVPRLAALLRPPLGRAEEAQVVRVLVRHVDVRGEVLPEEVLAAVGADAVGLLGRDLVRDRAPAVRRDLVVLVEVLDHAAVDVGPCHAAAKDGHLAPAAEKDVPRPADRHVRAAGDLAPVEELLGAAEHVQAEVGGALRRDGVDLVEEAGRRGCCGGREAELGEQFVHGAQGVDGLVERELGGLEDLDELDRIDDLDRGRVDVEEVLDGLEGGHRGCGVRRLG